MTSPLSLCVIGGDTSSSLSPVIHRAALRAAGLDGDYTALDVACEGLDAVLARIRSGEIDGANVTIPHKVAVAELCDRLDGDAARTGAVNTLLMEGDVLVGENTDPAGLEAALRRDGLVPPPDSAAVVLGAGGAAAGVLLALARLRVGLIAVCGRNVAAVRDLSARVDGAPPLGAVPWDASALRPHLRSAAMLVNTTPVALTGLPLSLDELPETCIVVDIRYTPQPVDVTEAARARGLRACDGLEMLLQQALLSFARWTGATPLAEPVRAALKAAADAQAPAAGVPPIAG